LILATTVSEQYTLLKWRLTVTVAQIIGSSSPLFILPCL